MKNLVIPVVSLMLLFSAASCTSSHYVSAQPGPVMITRPAPPHPNYVWVDGNYNWRGGRYAYSPGYWVAPRPGRVYQPGGWVNTSRGYYWRGGGWRR